jgi:hypothetical protein
MNCIEALHEQVRECEPCIRKSQIIEFHELPEREKFNFDYYEKDKHFLLYCKKCDFYKILGET